MQSGIDQVVANGLCVGCGACSVVDPSYQVKRNQYGVMQAQRVSGNRVSSLASSVCPFSSDAQNESVISGELYTQACTIDDRIGRYLSISAGRVNQGGDIQGSSSGGLTSWICLALLRSGLVDGVIHVGSGGKVGSDLFQYCISMSEDEVCGRRKSQYYSVSFDGVLKSIRSDGKRYAFVGVPCYVKAVRLLCRQDEVLEKQIKFTIGLVCGHMKSSAFSELLAWQVGVAPENLKAVDFRVKKSGLTADNYYFSATDKDGTVREGVANRLLGGNWGHATFQLEACDYCDDIFAETADVVLGDAWLKKYISEWRGTNVVATRHPVIEQLLAKGGQDGSIFLEPLSSEDLVRSQAGNFRHRRDGLSVRLNDKVASGEWFPVKRVAPGSRVVDEKRVKIVRLRQRMARESHRLFLEAKSRGSLQYYINATAPLVGEMRCITKLPVLIRVSAKFRRLINAIFG